jgi:hypothetical protein
MPPQDAPKEAVKGVAEALLPVAVKLNDEAEAEGGQEYGKPQPAVESQQIFIAKRDDERAQMYRFPQVFLQSLFLHLSSPIKPR